MYCVNPQAAAHSGHNWCLYTAWWSMYSMVLCVTTRGFWGHAASHVSSEVISRHAISIASSWIWSTFSYPWLWLVYMCIVYTVMAISRTAYKTASYCNYKLLYYDAWFLSLAFTHFTWFKVLSVLVIGMQSCSGPWLMGHVFQWPPAWLYHCAQACSLGKVL